MIIICRLRSYNKDSRNDQQNTRIDEKRKREERASMKWNKKLFTIAKTFLLLLTLILPLTVQKNVLAENETGSITISLKDLETPKKDVAFKAYEVGERDAEGNWQLVESLKGIEISLKDLVYAEEWDAAALKLVQEADLDALISAEGKTDEEGKLTFHDLDWGLYLVVPDGENEYGTVSPFLAGIPYVEDGVRKSDLTVQPKAEPPLLNGNGRIEVTKRVGRMDPELLEVVDIILTEDVSYYIGIFKDKQGKIPYGTDYLREIPMKNLTVGTAAFENLPAGTYYIFETDKDGNAYPINERLTLQDDIWVCRLEDGDSQEVTLDGKETSEAGKVGFYNQYYDMNRDYSYKGTLNISKKVIDNGSEITVPETFYAGIFEDEAGKELNSVVELTQNGTVTVELSLGGQDWDKPITYYIYETDKDGNRVDKASFAYNVSGEGKAELRTGKWEATVSLVNTKKADETETETKESETTTSVRTGDETPVAGYLLMMLTALLVLIVSSVYLRGYKRHE